MSIANKFDTMLPHAAPLCGDAHTLLFALRRMAVHGLNDAFASHAMFSTYGLRHRKPLLLLRALLVDIARSARGHVIVAPCCAPRMTAHEHALLAAMADPTQADERLSTFLKNGKSGTATATIAALNESLEAMGRSLSY